MVDAPRDEALRSFTSMASIDTCAVWNILCSQTLSNALRGRCHFLLAQYVRHECLVKPRKTREGHAALMAKLEEELDSGKHFSVHALTIEDLRDTVASIGKVKRFHNGELAALALARKLVKGFVSDDRAARVVAEDKLGSDLVRTTPHLVGLLVYQGHLSDGDIPGIIADNAALNIRYGSLGEYIHKCYEHAMAMRLRDHGQSLSAGGEQTPSDAPILD
ncbi:hypothetical protein [Azospirillum melinis]